MKIVATLPPMHPGEMLREEFLKPMDLTPYKVAKAARYDIRTAERAIAADLAAIETFKQKAA